MAIDLDVCGVGEEHGHAVDAHAPAAGGRQPALQSPAEILIENLCLVVAASLRREGKLGGLQEAQGGKQTLSLACPANISR